MLLSDTISSLGGSLLAVGQGALGIIPAIIVALIVFILGVLIAGILGRLVTELAQAIKLDAVLTQTGLREALHRGGIDMNAGKFIGGFIKWVVILAFLVTSLEIVGLTQVTLFLTDILGYVPQVIAAAIIIVVTAVIAEFLKKLVAGSTRAAALGGAEFSASVAKATVWVFGVIVALQELGLPTALFQIVITGVIAGLALAFGLSFGLGGRDTAARIIEKKYNEMHN